MSAPAERLAELRRLVDAAQRTAGVLVARGRGDREGAATLLASFSSQERLASGSLLLAELAVQQLGSATGRSSEECLQQLCLDMERALDS